ncbi:hypothetical protein Pcinc_040933 [Petrolisthes cinctipes]|uniref:Uncharacterized protein n=1 Tax=Petrolisthes cinctipes TaxID=88211 RepID=A0AAE1BKJ5_PETCI|nr:hypothetical protein Pcinc_040933 [Petrolisthes cinctipes]
MPAADDPTTGKGVISFSVISCSQRKRRYHFTKHLTNPQQETSLPQSTQAPRVKPPPAGYPKDTARLQLF